MTKKHRVSSFVIALVLASTFLAFQNCGSKKSEIATEADIQLNDFLNDSQLDANGELSISSKSQIGKNKQDKSGCPIAYKPVYKKGELKHCQMEIGSVGVRYTTCKYQRSSDGDYSYIQALGLRGDQCVELTTTECAPKMAVCPGLSYTCSCETVIRCPSGKYDPVEKKCL